MQDIHVRDLVDAYALGALEPEDVDTVEQHLDVCPGCQELAVAARVNAENLLYMVPQLTPPRRLRRQLMHRIAAEVESARHREPAPETAAPVPDEMITHRVAPAPPGRFRKAMHALLGSTALEEDPAGSVLRELLGEPDVEVWQARGTRDAPGASARIVGTPRHTEAVLVTSGLVHPEPGHAYQVWFIQGQNRLPNALFSVSRAGHGATVMHVEHPLGMYHGLAVTTEPEAGSAHPTGPVVLEAWLKRP